MVDIMDENIKNSAPWISAVGTIMSAVGSTPFEKIDKQILFALNLWGNILQGTGNALQADSIEDVTVEKIGNEIQATGNVTAVSGMVINFKEETQQRLIITGNWFQALGGLLAVAYEIDEPSAEPGPDQAKALDVIGNLLQSIGNSMQAIGGIEQLKGNEKEGETISVNGSWIQAVGSILSAIGETKDSPK